MRAWSGTRGPNTVSYSRKERVCMTRPQQSGTGKDFFPVPPLPLTACYMRCRAQILLPAGSLR